MKLKKKLSFPSFLHKTPENIELRLELSFTFNKIFPSEIYKYMENSPPPNFFFRGDLKDVDSAEIWAHRENEHFIDYLWKILNYNV